MGRNTKQAVRSSGSNWVYFLEEAKLGRKGERKGIGTAEDGEKRMEGEVEEAGDS